MQYIKQLFDDKTSKIVQFFSTKKSPRISVGIIGTGKIGTDLLVKVQRSPVLDCILFSGRNLASEGMQYAAKLGVTVSDKGIDAFTTPSTPCDIVFDATTAEYHQEHAAIFKKLGIFTIDMTPSYIGECCVPALGLSEIKHNHNISMISCGGQSAIPIAAVLANYIPTISAIEVRSIVSARSIGPGTLANIEAYYQNTKAGLFKYTGIANLFVDLQVDNLNLETKMYTTITAKTDFNDIHILKAPLYAILKKVQTYVPGYRLEAEPIIEADGIRIELSVEGAGDYLPKYAGNLDIINCAAIAVAEEFAQSLLHERLALKPHKNRILSLEN